MKIISPNIEHNPSVEKIATSYDSLKEGVVELAGQVKSEAGEAAGRMSTRTYDFLKSKLEDIRAEASNDFGKMKDYVRNEPAKGIAAAFVAGAVVSLLMRRG